MTSPVSCCQQNNVSRERKTLLKTPKYRGPHGTRKLSVPMTQRRMLAHQNVVRRKKAKPPSMSERRAHQMWIARATYDLLGKGETMRWILSLMTLQLPLHLPERQKRRPFQKASQYGIWLTMYLHLQPAFLVPLSVPSLVRYSMMRTLQRLRPRHRHCSRSPPQRLRPRWKVTRILRHWWRHCPYEQTVRS